MNLTGSVRQHFLEEFDETLSDFRAEALLDFFVAELGPAVYNQGVRDASSYMQQNSPISKAKSTSATGSGRGGR